MASYWSINILAHKKKETLKQIQRLPNNQTLSHTAGYKPYFVTAGSIKPEPPVASYFVTF